MIRFSWMQSRVQVIVAAGALVVVAVALAITGPHLVHLYDISVTNCRAENDCPTARSEFLRNDHTLGIWLGVLVVVVPGILGMFWGAPLVARELELGSHRLAWTQSVTRTRWMSIKLCLVGLASMAVVGLLSLMVTWWSSPLDHANMDPFGSFDLRDIVPVGYAAFAFVLGVTAGGLVRRTLPAMAITLVAFITVRLAFIHWIRPNLVTPLFRDVALNPASTGFGATGTLFSGVGQSTLQPVPPNIPGAWITSIHVVNKAGHALTSKVLATDCPDLGTGGPGGGGGGAGASHTRVPAGAQQVLQDCVAKVGATYHAVVAYQPASRYWPFQWYEMAIYLAAAVILSGFCIWWVRNRLV